MRKRLSTSFMPARMLVCALISLVTLSAWAAAFDVRVEPSFLKKYSLPNADHPTFYTFVRNGSANLATLSALLIGRFPEAVTSIPMQWQRAKNEIVEYFLAVDSQNYTVLVKPELDIPPQGCVNTTDWKTFNTSLICTGKAGAPYFTASLTFTIYEYSQPVDYADSACMGISSSGQQLTAITTRPNMTATLKMRKQCAEQSGERPTDSLPSSSSGLSAEEVVGIIVGCLAGILVIIIIGGVVWLNRLKKNRSHVMNQQSANYGSDGSRPPLSNPNGKISDSILVGESSIHTGTTLVTQQSVEHQSLDVMMQSLRKKWEPLLSSLLIPRPDVVIGEEVGRGAFGRVFVGSIHTDPGNSRKCAIKTIKVIGSEKDVNEFLEEALILKDFQHENVMGIYAVCMPENESPLVCLEYMDHGDLRSYLRRARGSKVNLLETSAGDPEVTSAQCIEFCVQIANGMDYLSSRNFVHRDLAARNCMLNGDLVVKIGDFGLARDMHEDHYYRIGTARCLPVKWMALESITDQIFTTKSDVWSFGVVMWEIFSLGITPYPGVANHDMLNYLYTEKRRLALPEGCPNDLYPIMSSCWSVQPSDRPSFQHLRTLLEEFKDSFYVNVQLHNRNAPEYLNVNPASAKSDDDRLKRLPSEMSMAYGSGASERIEPHTVHRPQKEPLQSTGAPHPENSQQTVEYTT